MSISPDDPSSVDEATSRAIDSSVKNSFLGLSSSITQVIESRLTEFASQFYDSTISSMRQAVQKAKQETYTCTSKGNQQQLHHEIRVLDKLEDASQALESRSYDCVKSLKEAITMVSKMIKAIKLADKSEYVG